MSKIILYHGSPNKIVTPKYGFGQDKHDYGRGFYLTESIELAREWAVCNSNSNNGYLHKFELELNGLNILDFDQYGVLYWLAELMSHRDASDSKRYYMLAEKFINKYKINSEGFDIIKGWRADASYFFIAREFVRDNIDVNILQDLLMLGDLGIQFCIKSEYAFNSLIKLENETEVVDFNTYYDKYITRDTTARENMKFLVNSDNNKLINIFSTLI